MHTKGIKGPLIGALIRFFVHLFLDQKGLADFVLIQAFYGWHGCLWHVGLGWPRNMRWGTAGAFSKIFSTMDKDRQTKLRND